MAEIWNLRPADNAAPGLKPLKRLLPCPHCGRPPVFHHQPDMVWSIPGWRTIHTGECWYARCGDGEYGNNFLAFGSTLRQAQADWPITVSSAGTSNRCLFCGRPLAAKECNDPSPFGNSPCCDRCNNAIVVLGRLILWCGLHGTVRR